MPHSKSIHSQPNHTAGARKRLKHNRKVWGVQLATSKREKHWCGQCFPPIKQAFWLKLCYVEPLIGCQGFHTKMNIPSPLPTSLVFRSFCRLLICHLSGTFPILFAADLFSFCHFAMRLPSVQVQVLGRTLACFAGSSRHEQLWRSRSRDNSQLLNLKASSLHHPTKENQGNAWDADMNARWWDDPYNIYIFRHTYIYNHIYIIYYTF